MISKEQFVNDMVDLQVKKRMKKENIMLSKEDIDGKYQLFYSKWKDSLIR